MKILCKNKYWEIDKEYNINKILYLLIDRPNHINSLNDFIWENNENQGHRNYDLPSYMCFINRYISWHKNNEWHRENNKPAIIKCDGLKRYYINDKYIKTEFTNEIFD